jgi:hypothetical protein
MSSTAYKIFVMQASEAGQEIEFQGKELDFGVKRENLQWFLMTVQAWDFVHFIYRIKLPEGWEYIIEDGEIAFRVPNEEHFLDKDGSVQYSVEKYYFKRPIIKRVKTNGMEG